MKNFAFPFLLLLILLLSENLQATRYYFSSVNGNDNNAGTSPAQAWQSIPKLQETINNTEHGDVILLERGSVWEDAGISIRSKINLTLTAYGNGNAPVISGYKILTNPVDNGDNTYTYSEPRIENDYRKIVRFVDGQFPWYACNLNFLLIDGKPYDMGRHPNGKNYYDAESVNPGDYKSWFTETDEVWANGHWDGAQVKMFPEHWVPEDIRVVNYTDNTFNLNAGDWNSMYNLSKQNLSYATGIKYYIFNHRNALDKDGEWCLDRENKTITLYSSGPVDNKKVMQSFNDSVVVIDGCANLRISNIEFRGGKTFTMKMINSSRVDIDSCIFRYTPLFAAFIDNNSLVSFQHDSIIDATNMGIFFHSNNGETAKYCYGKNIGVSEGIGGDRDNNCFRFLNSHQRDGGLTYHCNQVDSFGYAAIGIFLPNSSSERPVSVKYNHLKNGPMLLTDAAAFYCAGDRVSAKKEVKYNVVENVYSNNGNSWDGSTLSMALYLDTDSKDFEVDSNTVIGAQYGIYLNGTHHNNMRNNHLAKLTKTGMVGKAPGYGHNGAGTLYCNYANNVSVAANSNATGFEWYYGSRFSGGNTVADSNDYYNPFRSVDVSIGRYSEWTKYFTSLEEWNTISGWEAHSTFNKNGYRNNPFEILPAKCVKVLWNLSPSFRTVDLLDCTFVDLDGKEVSGSVQVPPNYSEILFLTSGDSVDLITEGHIGYFDEPVTSTRKYNNKISSVHYYPVPVKGDLFISELPAGTIISVFDINGRKMSDQICGHRSKQQIKMHDFDAGIYIVRIEDSSNQRYENFKIVKQ